MIFAVKYVVKEISLATPEDRARQNITRGASLYRADIHAETLSEYFTVINKSAHILTKEHPLIGDTYTLTFEKDEK